AAAFHEALLTLLVCSLSAVVVPVVDRIDAGEQSAAARDFFMEIVVKGDPAGVRLLNGAVSEQDKALRCIDPSGCHGAHQASSPNSATSSSVIGSRSKSAGVMPLRRFSRPRGETS